MKGFTVKVPCKSASEAARVWLLVNRIRPKTERITQTAIAGMTRCTVQNVNEQIPKVKAMLKATAR